MTATHGKQLPFRFRTWGGKRKRAGRKPNGETAGVSHLERERFARTFPVHVTMRVARHVYNLRSRRSFSVIARAMVRAAERFGTRIVRYSVQGNHVHLIVEASSDECLSRAMQGFSIRVAKGLNAMMKRRGRVLDDRYHAHVLRTPSETRRAIRYLRDNHRKHEAAAARPTSSRADEYATEGRRIALKLRPHGSCEPSPAKHAMRAKRGLRFAYLR